MEKKTLAQQLIGFNYDFEDLPQVEADENYKCSGKK